MATLRYILLILLLALSNGANRKLRFRDLKAALKLVVRCVSSSFLFDWQKAHIFAHSQDDPAKRIVGGVNAMAGRFPYFVHLFSEEGSCSGSLIAPDAVLTAARCM
jgi:secreted trypsin-like serine protease